MERSRDEGALVPIPGEHITAMATSPMARATTGTVEFARAAIERRDPVLQETSEFNRAGRSGSAYPC